MEIAFKNKIPGGGHVIRGGGMRIRTVVWYENWDRCRKSRATDYSLVIRTYSLRQATHFFALLFLVLETPEYILGNECRPREGNGYVFVSFDGGSNLRNESLTVGYIYGCFWYPFHTLDAPTSYVHVVARLDSKVP